MSSIESILQMEQSTYDVLGHRLDEKIGFLSPHVVRDLFRFIFLTTFFCHVNENGIPDTQVGVAAGMKRTLDWDANELELYAFEVQNNNDVSSPSSMVKESAWLAGYKV